MIVRTMIPLETGPQLGSDRPKRKTFTKVLSEVFLGGAMSRYKLRRCVVAVIFAGFWSGICSAQQTTAITGQVTDQTGAVIPKIKVIAHNESTNQDVSSISTSTGNFTFSDLRPGIYDVSASAHGFANTSENGIHLELDATVTVVLSMKPGAANETITVQAQEEQLIPRVGPEELLGHMTGATVKVLGNLSPSRE